MRIKLLSILILPLSIYAQSVGTWLSPTGQNLGVKKSLVIGDGVGNDTLFGVGVLQWDFDPMLFGLGTMPILGTPGFYVTDNASFFFTIDTSGNLYGALPSILLESDQTTIDASDELNLVSDKINITSDSVFGDIGYFVVNGNTGTDSAYIFKVTEDEISSFLNIPAISGSFGTNYNTRINTGSSYGVGNLNYNNQIWHFDSNNTWIEYGIYNDTLNGGSDAGMWRAFWSAGHPHFDLVLWNPQTDGWDSLVIHSHQSGQSWQWTRSLTFEVDDTFDVDATATLITGNVNIGAIDPSGSVDVYTQGSSIFMNEEVNAYMELAPAQVRFIIDSNLATPSTTMTFLTQILGTSNRTTQIVQRVNKITLINDDVGTPYSEILLDDDSVKLSSTQSVYAAITPTEFNFNAGFGTLFSADADSNFVVGIEAALATSATDGFLYVPTCAGTPTGTPRSITGKVPIVVNSTNNKLYFYSGGAWRDAGP